MRRSIAESKTLISVVDDDEAMREAIVARRTTGW
jgi:hypothetical protein